MDKKFCIECRFELPITAKFCERCGFTFVLNESTSESEPEIKEDKQPSTQPVTEISKDVKDFIKSKINEGWSDAKIQSSVKAKYGIDAIETFIQSSTRKKSRGKGSGFLKFIIILTIMTISGAIGGFFGGMAFGGMGAAVGGIGSWILARIIAYPIAELIFPHRFEAEDTSEVSSKEAIKLSKKARDYKKKRSGSGCGTIVIVIVILGIVALLIFTPSFNSIF